MKDKYGRTYEAIKNHYDVEKQIANKLKKSTREERTEIYRNMYDELFSKVPNHPRLLKRNNEEERKKSINNKLNFLLEFVNDSDTFLEVGPDDCRLAFEVCNYAQYVYGLDISDQIGDYPKEKIPANFELLIYDGYNLNMDDEKIDVSYSDQMIEHLHPDDIELHFQMINRILKHNGCYILEIPHNFKGLHDVSK
ncbi:methyltransferase domain-containing protein [Methanohalobium evestigatum]|uniref:methyltransferase domain-containing protein n=1 Tax=Methanohalobium evestigatum TaxID=2322 RepID=UPI000677A4F8|nr:methyltransferase domain-containing protein [Methanohalobium evestigatum]